MDEGIIKVFKESEIIMKIQINLFQTNKTINNKQSPENIMQNASKKIIVNSLEQEYKLLLKISGIWENNTTSGITYKF